MGGRESKRHNDLFYLCSLIEYIGRYTKNHNKVIVNAIGRDGMQKIFDLADVYHSDNIERVANDLIDEYDIPSGNFDITDIQYSVPSYWDVGKVYKRLIISLSADDVTKYIDILTEVYNSWIAESIDNYNSSFYYSSPDYIYKSYLAGEPL